jgi:hypothetical protein
MRLYLLKCAFPVMSRVMNLKAMHAVSQVERGRSEYGRGRYTLWTGDLGTALYLADCIDGGGQLPLP